ncbi:AAA family ATPase [Candidatus Pacearchaeota archaeon]|nr:AAA family ATPase [Candidatus Pacearchaeota archaeon]MBD3283476.1 AAA family ATPase [Candidatus Pacearchaeota archaeon]
MAKKGDKSKKSVKKKSSKKSESKNPVKKIVSKVVGSVKKQELSEQAVEQKPQEQKAQVQQPAEQKPATTKERQTSAETPAPETPEQKNQQVQQQTQQKLGSSEIQQNAEQPAQQQAPATSEKQTIKQQTAEQPSQQTPTAQTTQEEQQNTQEEEKPSEQQAEQKPKEKTSKTSKKQSASNRVPTGIKGFDELIGGGFPKRSSTLICGGPGTGKTIFCMEYLIKGATEFNEKGLYVSFEQREDQIKDQAEQFGWDIDKLEKQGMIRILSIPVEKISEKTIKRIQNLVEDDNIKRLVIDSLSTLVINAPIFSSKQGLAIKDVVGEDVIFSPPVVGDYFVQRFLYGFIENLRDLECTSLLVGEADQSGKFISRDTLSEFVCDGIVLISFESMGGDFSRSLIVRKMRHTKNNEDVHPLEISNKGLVVHSIE